MHVYHAVCVVSLIMLFFTGNARHKGNARI